MVLRKRTRLSAIIRNYRKRKLKGVKRHVGKNRRTCEGKHLNTKELLVKILHDRKNSWNTLFNKYETYSSCESLSVNSLDDQILWEEENDKHVKNCNENSVNPEKKTDTQSNTTLHSLPECYDSGIELQDSVNTEKGDCGNRNNDSYKLPEKTTNDNHNLKLKDANILSRISDFGNQKKDSPTLSEKTNNDDHNLKLKDVNILSRIIETPILHQHASFNSKQVGFDSGVKLRECVVTLERINHCKNQGNDSSALLCEANNVNYNLRPEDINVRREIVEKLAFHQSINLSSKEIGSSSIITERFRECENVNSKDNYFERSKICQDCNSSENKIDSECAERLQICREISSNPRNICFQSEIPVRENSSVAGRNICPKQVDSFLNQNCSENKIVEELVFGENKVPSVQNIASVDESSDTCSVSIFSEEKCVSQSRSEIKQVNFCNLKDDFESKENKAGKKQVQNQNSNHQVLSNKFLESDYSEVGAVMLESTQDNITSVSQFHGNKDSLESNPSSPVPVCDKLMVKNTVSKQELWNSRSPPTTTYKNIKLLNHQNAIFLDAAPKETHATDSQNKGSNESYFDGSEILFSNASPIKRKLINKEIIAMGNIDKMNAESSCLSSKKDCERAIERESCLSSKKNNEKEKMDLKNNTCNLLKPNSHIMRISKWDLEIAHFFNNQWEEFVKKPGSVMIPLTKKRKKCKLQKMDWESIMNGK